MWKVINDFSNYEVNENGVIRNKTTKKVLKERPTNCGYVRVKLYENKVPKEVSIHRIVAETFIPKTDPLKTDVNHINGIKKDNRVGNLEWCTKSENIRHAQEIGLKTYEKISRRISLANEREKKIFKSLTEASVFLGCAHQKVSYYALRHKPLNGYTLEYI